MTDKEIIELAEKRGLEFYSFCIINFVREKLDNRKSIDNILDEFEDLISY